LQPPESDIIFFYGKGNESHQLGTGFFVHHIIISAVKTAEFVSDISLLDVINKYIYTYIYTIYYIKSIRMRLVGHVARMRGQVHTGFWWGNLKERDHLEDKGADGKIILKWIFRMWDGWPLNGFIWLRIGSGSGHF
jgi:hypothetical protein